MDGRGNLLVRKKFVGNTFVMTFPEYFILKTEEQERVISEEEDSEYLYAVPFEEVNHFHRNTRSYVRKFGGLKVIHALPRRKAPKKPVSYTRD